jgi:hypothetical protein
MPQFKPRSSVVALSVAAALGIGGSLVGAVPAHGDVARVIVTPQQSAIALTDTSNLANLVSDGLVQVDVIDENGDEISYGSTRNLSVQGPGCYWAAGQAPSIRDCSLTVGYQGVTGAAQLQVWDLTAMGGGIQGQARAGTVATAPGTPDGWPGLTYRWYWTDQPTATRSDQQSYAIGFEDIGHGVTAEVRQTAHGLDARYPAAARTYTLGVVPKATTTTTARLVKQRINTKTRPAVSVSVAAMGTMPLPGEANLSIQVDGRVTYAKIWGGSGVVKLPKQAVGNHQVTVTFAGSLTGQASAAPAQTLTVLKAKASSLKAKLAKKTVKRSQRAKVVVRVGGAKRPTGTVTVRWGKKGVAKVALKAAKSGKATIKLPKLKKGTHKLTVRYSGGGALKASSAKLKLRVR